MHIFKLKFIIYIILKTSFFFIQVSLCRILFIDFFFNSADARPRVRKRAAEEADDDVILHVINPHVIEEETSELAHPVQVQMMT